MQQWSKNGLFVSEKKSYNAQQKRKLKLKIHAFECCKLHLCTIFISRCAPWQNFYKILTIVGFFLRTLQSFTTWNKNSKKIRFTAFKSVNLNLKFGFLLSVVRFFFTELRNTEAKLAFFASMLHNSVKKIVQHSTKTKIKGKDSRFWML